MLTYFVEKFKIQVKSWKEFVNDLHQVAPFYDYRNLLLGKDYVCRKGHATYMEETNQHVVFSGILGYHSAIDDVQDVLKTKISDVICDRSVEYFNVSPDEYYCEHKTWKSLLLRGDHVSGTPPLQCAECKGFVAQYRLQIDPKTGELIWYWIRQLDAIEDCSSLCSEYETWADEQLSNIQSKINRMGLKIAKKLSRTLEADVSLLFDSGDEDKDLQRCPQCNKPFEKSTFGPTYRLSCSSCHLSMLPTD